MYLRERYYNPTLGVFTALDPLEGEVRQLMSLDRYSYVQGNVINWTDPSGKTCNAIVGDDCGWKCWPLAEGGLSMDKCLHDCYLEFAPTADIINSSVIIVFLKPADPTYTVVQVRADITNSDSSKYYWNNSLGIFTPAGILTHDHYVGDDQKISDQILTNGEYSYILLRGMTQSNNNFSLRYLPYADFQMTYPPTTPGITLLSGFFMTSFFGGKDVTNKATVSLLKNGDPLYFLTPKDNSKNVWPTFDYYEIEVGFYNDSLFPGQKDYQLRMDNAVTATGGQSGSSGGGVFDRSGNLIGIIYGGASFLGHSLNAFAAKVSN